MEGHPPPDIARLDNPLRLAPRPQRCLNTRRLRLILRAVLADLIACYSFKALTNTQHFRRLPISKLKESFLDLQFPTFQNAVMRLIQHITACKAGPPAIR
jgi:hypothetical protein